MTGAGKTGDVGGFRNRPGRTLWFRADMDASALHETTGPPRAAGKPRRLPDGSGLRAMHACGHDVHVTRLLGLATAMTAAGAPCLFLLIGISDACAVRRGAQGRAGLSLFQPRQRFHGGPRLHSAWRPRQHDGQRLPF